MPRKSDITMGYYQEEIMVECIISFKMPKGYDEENIVELLPNGVKDWDDLELDDETNIVNGKYTYRTSAKCHYDSGDYWTPPTDVVEEYEQCRMVLDNDLIISEVHDIIDFMG